MKVFGFLSAFAATAIAIWGDYLLKVAAEPPGLTNVRWPQFWFGTAIYAGAAILWVFAFKGIKFSSLGPIYTALTIIMCAVLGTTCFGEKISKVELVGIAFACISVVLMWIGES